MSSKCDAHMPEACLFSKYVLITHYIPDTQMALRKWSGTKCNMDSVFIGIIVFWIGVAINGTQL